MKYYSTNKQAPVASLQEAVVKGLAADKGLFMPMSSHAGEIECPRNGGCCRR